MFETARHCIYQRRKGLLKTVSLLGGVYLAGRYALERLEEMREQAAREKMAREKWVDDRCMAFTISMSKRPFPLA